MASGLKLGRWSVRVNAKIGRAVPETPDAGRVAAMFGLAAEQTETLYEDFDLSIGPGEIVVVTGPSGAGKSVLLREVAAALDGARWLGTEALRRSDAAAGAD